MLTVETPGLVPSKHELKLTSRYSKVYESLTGASAISSSELRRELIEKYNQLIDIFQLSGIIGFKLGDYFYQGEVIRGEYVNFQVYDGLVFELVETKEYRIIPFDCIKSCICFKS